MAENELTVVRADGATRTLRSKDVGGNVQAQIVAVTEAPEAPVDPTGGAVRYNVDSSPAVSLNSPNAVVHSARVRVYETAGPAGTNRRLYYRTDGTNPTSDGANAFGFLLHGDVMTIRLASPDNFRMIADSSDNGVFEVYVEWLVTPSS
jgi:hypothetical protein